MAVPRRRRRFRPGEPPRTVGARGADADRPPPAPAARPEPAAQTSGVHDPQPEPAQPDEREVERGLRGLVGGGASQVGVRAAMRARDAARPTEVDLAAAEANLVIVRRGWVPREDPPRSVRPR